MMDFAYGMVGFPVHPLGSNRTWANLSTRNLNGTPYCRLKLTAVAKASIRPEMVDPSLAMVMKRFFSSLHDPESSAELYIRTQIGALLDSEGERIEAQTGKTRLYLGAGDKAPHCPLPGKSHIDAPPSEPGDPDGHLSCDPQETGDQGVNTHGVSSTVRAFQGRWIRGDVSRFRLGRYPRGNRTRCSGDGVGRTVYDDAGAHPQRRAPSAPEQAARPKVP